MTDDDMAHLTRERDEALAAVERVRALLDWPVGRDTGGVDRLIPASEVRAALGERP